jgi:hypothetical protein
MKVDTEFVDNKRHKPSDVRVSLHSDRQKAGRATKEKIECSKGKGKINPSSRN